MPIPDRNKGESESDFMSRCMGDATMMNDYGDQAQRAAICYRQARMMAEDKPFTMSAAVDIRAEAGDAADGTPKLPTFAIAAYSGAEMRLEGFNYPVIVDLSGLKATRQRIPILLDHDPTRIIGQATPSIDASGVRLEGTITGDDSDARKVITHARNGFEWQASIGASIVRQEFLKPGNTSIVNGREVRGPILIAREARLQETSFVAVGADSRTAATVAASHAGNGGKRANSMFEQWLEAKGFAADGLSDAQRDSLRAMYDGDEASKRKGPATQGLEEILASARKEEERVGEIARITAQAIQERPMLLDRVEAMSKAAIEAKTTPVEYELQVLRETRAPANVRVHGDRKASGKVIEAALCIAGGLDGIDRHFDAQVLNAASDRFPHGLGLRDVLVMSARENGYAGHSSNDVRTLLRAAFSPSMDIRADGFSTTSLPIILGNVANKYLAAGFTSVEDSWRAISAVRSVRDFKTITTAALTGGMMYEKVGPAGELKHATIGETTYTNKADTYGRMFAITRTDIINDDLGALTEVPRKLGRGAALKLNDVFWTAFMSVLGTTFTSGRANYLSGVTVGTNDSRLNDEGLTRATTSFTNQTDPDGYPIGVKPSILLVPNALLVAAKSLMTSTEIRDTTANTRIGTANVWSGMFTVVGSSYLSNSNYTGYSTTAWYLLADPADLPLMEIAFLNGRQQPVVESADAEFSTLGVEFRGFFDFGCSVQEYRAGVMSKGAA